MASAPSAIGRYTLGGVFGRMLSVIARNFIPVLGIGAVGGLVSALLSANTIEALAQVRNPAQPLAALAVFTSSTYWLTALGGIVVGALVQAMLMAVLVEGDGDGPADLNLALTRGIQSFLPLLLLTILWWLGVMVGYLMLIVPSLILISMWSVSAPVLVAERSGVIAAFGRSRRLTKGLRWPILGTLVVFLLFDGIILLAVQGFSLNGMATLYRSDKVAAIAVGVAGNMVMTILLTAFLAALYREVLEAKEGGSNAELADVFA